MFLRNVLKKCLHFTRFFPYCAQRVSKLFPIDPVMARQFRERQKFYILRYKNFNY